MWVAYGRAKLSSGWPTFKAQLHSREPFLSRSNSWSQSTPSQFYKALSRSESSTSPLSSSSPTPSLESSLALTLPLSSPGQDSSQAGSISVSTSDSQTCLALIREALVSKEMRPRPSHLPTFGPTQFNRRSRRLPMLSIRCSLPYTY